LMSSGGASQGSGVVPRHASERSLMGYCSFHHMLLALCQRHPSITQVATDKLRSFVRGACSKAEVPDLGQLIVYMTVAEDVEWCDVAAAIMTESHVRGALWLLREHPELGRDVSDESRLSCTFASRLVSVRLLMFQAHFLRCIARPRGETLAGGLARYCQQFGLPTEPQKELLVGATRDILAVDSWPEVYRYVGLNPPTKSSLAKQMRDAMLQSAKRGYHNAAVLGPFGTFAAQLRMTRAPQVSARVGVQNSLQQAFAAKGTMVSAKGNHPLDARPSANPVRMLTFAEAQQAKKFEKTLREIAALEMRLARGEKLDKLQVKKVETRSEVEGSAVMLKLRAGWLRPPVKE